MHNTQMGDGGCGATSSKGRQHKTPFAAFDIETQRLFRDGEAAGSSPIPLVSVVICTDTVQMVWTAAADEPCLQETDVCAIIDTLWRLRASHVLVTWSGTNADWPLLAAACGGSARHVQLCASMACFSVDLPLIVLACKGFMVGLEACAQATGLPHACKPIASAAGPALWKAGQRDKVVELCVCDARNTLAVAQHIDASRIMKWCTKKGKVKTLFLPCNLPTLVAIQCVRLRPLPKWRWNLDITPASAFAWMHNFSVLRPICRHVCVAADPFVGVPTFDAWVASQHVQRQKALITVSPIAPATSPCNVPPPPPAVAASPPVSHTHCMGLTVTPIAVRSLRPHVPTNGHQGSFSSDSGDSGDSSDSSDSF